MSLRRAGVVTALCVALLGADAARGDTLNVPSGAHPTVQSALDAAYAAPGADTVSLAPGTYPENVRVNPQWVTIAAPAGPAQTVLDAAGEDESAMRIIGGNVTVRGLTITGGTGTEFGGRRGGGVQIVSLAAGDPATVTFANCVLSRNSVLDSNSVGGGAFIGGGSTATFNDCIVEDNRAGDGGGGLYGSIGSTIRVNGGAIRDNQAGVRSATGGGGGIEVFRADAFIRGTAITGNSATAAGGAVHSINTLSTTERRLVMSDCSVSNNATASGDPDDQGGGIHVEDRVSLVMTNCTVSDNTADSGGGISSFRADVEVTDSVIADNQANISGRGGGGGVMSIGAQAELDGRCPVVHLTRTAVVGNTAAHRGGGVLSSEGAGCGDDERGVARLEIAASTVSGNTTESTQGGGVIAINTNLSIADSHVNGNIVEGAAGFGGGILVNQGLSTATIRRTTIAGNQTPERAAGIYVTGGGSPTLNLIDSYLYANESPNPDPNRGGGLEVGTGSGALADGTVSANVIADNSSYQIAEPDFGRTDLVYSDNEFGAPAPGLENLIYRSTAPGAILELDTVAEFNAATLGPPDRTVGNSARAPNFTSFLAAPTRFAPAAPGVAYLSWSAARASSTALAGDPTLRPATDATEVSGGACDESRTFELRVNRPGGLITRQVTVDGPPCAPEPIPICPAGTTASVTCSIDARGRLVFRGTRAAEVLVGTGGADVLNGNGGADRLRGKRGKDGFRGGGGKDRINSKGQRRERVRCGAGKDRVRGARGDRVKRDCEKVRR